LLHADLPRASVIYTPGRVLAICPYGVYV
jgi:hypothetical protein